MSFLFPHNFITTQTSCLDFLSRDKSLREESILPATPIYIKGSHGMQHGGCEVKQMNLKSGQWCTSPNAKQKNIIGQQPGSNGSVIKLLQLIYKGCVYWWEKSTPKDYHGPLSENSVPSVWLDDDNCTFIPTNTPLMSNSWSDTHCPNIKIFADQY